MNDLILNEGYTSDRITFSSSEDCYIFDDKGTRYIDLTMGSGTHLLGHNNKYLTDEIIAQIKKGTLFTVKNNLTSEVAKLIRKSVPNAERIVFCNTGSEATMRAARIARAYTKKKKIAIFSGGWHGGNELYLYDIDYFSESLMTRHKSSGIPDEFKDLVTILPYNDEKAFEIIKNNSDNLAMVIIEPSQGSNPRDDIQPFLLKLREITREMNIVLCFDEIITGFRVSLGGAQEYFNIKADLITYGKTLGAGLPLGVITGNANIMDTIKGDSKNLPVFMGGTFSGNPLTMSATKAFLQYLHLNKNVYKELEEKSRKLKININNYCIDNNIPLRMIGLNSMLRFIFTDYAIKSRKERELHEISFQKQKDFYSLLLEKKKIFINSNGIIFLSSKHSSEILDYLLESFIDIISLFFKDK